MGIIHILKDGSVVNDISGHVVRVADAGTLYQLIHNINRTGSKTKSNIYEQSKNEVRI